MARKKFSSVYVDRLTGKVVSKRKWSTNKNKRYGGGYHGEPGTKRFVKKRFKIREEGDKGTVGDVFEWVVGFSYEKSGRSFDVIVTARDEAEAYGVAIDFLQHDREAQRIVRSGMKGWIYSPAKGKLTNVEAGNAEYRNQS
jgi:hypothetical protein